MTFKIPRLQALPVRALAALALALCAAAAPARGADDPRLKWSKSWGPLVPHKKFPRDCSLCHVAKRWDVMRPDFKFDHLKETGYALLGAHASASCLRCHNDRGPVKAYAVRGCGGCHVDPHKRALGLDCERCHGQQDWRPSGAAGEKLSAHARTRFPLTGMHAALACDQCHVRASAGDFSMVSTDCQSCHEKDFRRGPGHVAQGYSRDCRQCHTTSLWQGGTFNHSSLSGSLTCVNCHSAAFASANPTPAAKHSANGFPTTCQTCHNTTLWGPGTAMNHAAVSGAACATCHQADYNGAPNHVALSFPTTCASCHSGTTTWLGAQYDHTSLGGSPVCSTCHSAVYASAKTTPASNHSANSFPTTCQNCHAYSTPFPPPWGPGTAMNHAVVPTTCATCHTGDYNAATSPVNHVAQGIPASQCYTCHKTYVTWTSFTHSPSSCYNTTTYSAHHGASCATCHPGANYASYSCASCHSSNPGSTCN